MSPARFVAAATVVIVAVLCAPYAWPAGFNSADAIVILAPLVLFAVVARPTVQKVPAGGALPPQVPVSPSTVPPAGSSPVPASRAVAGDVDVLPRRASWRARVGAVCLGVFVVLVVVELLAAVVVFA